MVKDKSRAGQGLNLSLPCSLHSVLAGPRGREGTGLASGPGPRVGGGWRGRWDEMWWQLSG